MRKLVAGAGVYIYNKCIELCQEVLDDDSRSAPGQGQVPPPSQREPLTMRLRC
ncbi:MAG: hypothetical protein M3072_04080 [Candidatus Dormibacteraeota bacterium]|nr:hypothetical protein [Candidatus Dormibacteraeota bacterium]